MTAGLALRGGGRERLANRRLSATQDIRWRGHVFHITVGFYDDGRPGEIFAKRQRDQADLGAMVDKYCISVSHSLQWGRPLDDVVGDMTLVAAGVDKEGRPLTVPETALDAALVVLRDLSANVELVAAPRGADGRRRVARCGTKSPDREQIQ